MKDFLHSPESFHWLNVTSVHRGLIFHGKDFRDGVRVHFRWTRVGGSCGRKGQKSIMGLRTTKTRSFVNRHTKSTKVYSGIEVI